jgi:hypothetical protein
LILKHTLCCLTTLVGGLGYHRSEVVGFQPVSGEHSGWNLGQYFVGLCDHVEIFNNNGSKVCTLHNTPIKHALYAFTPTAQLFTVTLDNALNNTSTCQTIENFHTQRQYGLWKADENQLPYAFIFGLRHEIHLPFSGVLATSST